MTHPVNSFPLGSGRLIFLVASLVSFAATTSFARAQTGDVSKGQKIAEQACTECHAVKRDERVSPHFNVAPFRQIANTPGMTAQALFIWMTTSHPTMPNIILEEGDRRDVIAYIASLKDK